MDHPSPPEYREPRNRRSSFSESDDVLVVRTVLENLDIFSFIQSQRTRAWKIITQCLCDQGITCTTESVRYRINRLTGRYQEEFAEGRGPDGDTEITPLEQLLAQYIAARDQFERRGKTLPGLLHDQSSNAQTCQVLDNTRRASDDLNDSTTTSDMTTQDLPDAPLSTAPASDQAGQQSSKKPRKRRFYFESEHDEILLKLMLADEGVITASGVRRPQWKKIEADVNSRGMRVNTHTIRTHLRLLVDAFRKEEDMGYIKPDKMSEKQRLLREYCRKLDIDTKQSASSSNENQFLRLTQGNECERCRDSSTESRWRSKPDVFPAMSEPLSRAQVPTLSGTRASFDDFPAIVHTPETAAVSSPDHVATSTKVVEDTTTLRSETAILHPISMSTNTADHVSPGVASVSSANCPSSFIDSSARAEETSCTEAGEPASKKRKVKLDAVLDRFIVMQRDHYREQREYERAVASEQRTLQRQTIELQTRALDIQEKSMGMQERLMAMMEKVMDKLN